MGLRNGELLIFVLETASEISRFKCGVKSVSLGRSGGGVEGNVIVNSDSPWLLTRSADQFQLLPISISNVDLMCTFGGDMFLYFETGACNLHIGSFILAESNYYRFETVYGVNMPKRLVYDSGNGVLYLSRLEVSDAGNSGQVRKSFIRSISFNQTDFGAKTERIPECENSKDTSAICLWNIGGGGSSSGGDTTSNNNPNNNISSSTSILVVGAGTPYSKIPRAKISFYQVQQRDPLDATNMASPGQNNARWKLKKFFDLPSLENASAITCVKTFEGYLLASFNNILNLYRYNSANKT